MTHPEDDQTKPGPANPAAEGVDAPAPPGGPLRQDGVGGTKERGPAEADDAGDSDGSGADVRSSTISIEDEPGSGAPQDDTGQDVPGRDDDGLQEENAETSLDQPST